MSFNKEREIVDGKKIEILFPLQEIDSYIGEELRNYIDTVNDEIDAVIINFSSITYLNSSGLRELIQTLKFLKEKGKSLILTNINDDIKKIFVHTNLDRLFKIAPDNESAKLILTGS